jgi:tetratricopeptide (TPR) repeat protein/4-amino-4-deoxy-L-arabinose transferase-like glycosyltransferase
MARPARKRKAHGAQRAVRRALQVEDERESRARWYLALAAIAAIAFAIRLVYLLELKHDVTLQLLVGDAQRYDAWAVAIAHGDWLGSGVFFQTPLYPYLLACVYKIWGHDPFLIRLMQAAGDSIACFVLGTATLRLVKDRRAALAAATLVALYAPAVFFTGLLQKAALDLILVVSIIYLTAAIVDNATVGRTVALGTLVGLLTLNRENARVLYPLLLVWLLLLPANRSRRLAAGLAFSVGVVGIVTPVLVRNLYVGHEFAISTSQFGANFYIGNHAGASGLYEPLAPEAGNAWRERDAASQLAERAAGRRLTPAEVSDFWFKRAVADIRADPVRALRLFARKSLLAINKQEMPDTESIEFYAQRSHVLSTLTWCSFGLIFPLAGVGAFVAAREARRLVGLYVIGGGLFVSMVVFFVMARYRYPAVPVFIMLSGVAISRFTKRTVWLETRWALTLPILALLLVASHLPLIEEDPTGYNIGIELLRAGRSSEALPLLREAVRRSPQMAAAHLGYGMALVQTGSASEAIPEFRTAIASNRDDNEAYAQLAAALLATGRPVEAIPYAREAVSRDSSHVEAHSCLAAALWQTGNRTDALREFEAAATLRPNDSRLRNNLASALLAQGDARRATEEYAAALSIDPSNREIKARFFAALSEAGDTASAIDHLRALVPKDPNDAAYPIALAEYLVQTGATEEAIAQLRAVLSIGRAQPLESIQALALLAQAYERGGRHSEAVAACSRALAQAQEMGDSAVLASIRRLSEQLAMRR